MPRLLVVSLAWLATIPIAAASAGRPGDPLPTAPAGFDQQIVYHTFEFAPFANVRAPHSEYVSCPKGWTANSGGLARAPIRVKLVSAGPVPSGTLSLTDWEFDVKNFNGEKVLVTLWLECLRPRAARPPRRVAGRKLVRYRVSQLTGKVVKLRCPPRMKPTGFGWSLLGPNPEPLKAAGFDAEARFTAIKPVARGYDLTATAGSADAAGELTSLCYPETVTTRRGAEQRVTLDRVRIPGSAPPGISTLKASCGTGRVPIGGPGFSADPALTVVPALAPDGAPQLGVSNPTGAPSRLTMLLSCSRGRLVKFVQTGITVETIGGPITITQGS